MWWRCNSSPPYPHFLLNTLTIFAQGSCFQARSALLFYKGYKSLEEDFMKKSIFISLSCLSLLLLLVCLYYELRLNWNWGIALDERVSIQEFRNMCGISSMISALLLGLTVVINIITICYYLKCYRKSKN